MHAFDLDGMLRRLHLPTVRRLYPEREVRAEAEDHSYRDFLATLIAEEVAHRAQTRIERSVRKARFPFLRTIEDFDFTFQTSIRLQLLGSYLGPELVTEGRCLILYGPSGTGKTHLLPGQVMDLTAPLQDAPPEPADGHAKAAECAAVERHTVVAEVPAHDRAG